MEIKLNQDEHATIDPTGLTLSAIPTLTIIILVTDIYDPSAVMTGFQLSNQPAVQQSGKSGVVRRILACMNRKFERGMRRTGRDERTDAIKKCQ